ncbi:MAG: hypothetical protein MZV63_12105 [Marinilabiliales bacterium]|nr:hypothetical protein [Marinilabiliales bacterium]
MLEKAGLFDKPEPCNRNRARISPSTARSCVEAAREAIVLLKNDGIAAAQESRKIHRGHRPVRQQRRKFSAAAVPSVTPHYVVTPVRGIRNRAGKKIKVDYAPGLPYLQDPACACARHFDPPPTDAADFTSACSTGLNLRATRLF